jgi:hypothetical protein
MSEVASDSPIETPAAIFNSDAWDFCSGSSALGQLPTITAVMELVRFRSGSHIKHVKIQAGLSIGVPPSDV